MPNDKKNMRVFILQQYRRMETHSCKHAPWAGECAAVVWLPVAKYANHLPLCSGVPALYHAVTVATPTGTGGE